jgi:hypothetical protein
MIHKKNILTIFLGILLTSGYGSGAIVDVNNVEDSYKKQFGMVTGDAGGDGKAIGATSDTFNTSEFGASNVSANQSTNQPVYTNQATNQPASLNQATNQPVYANQATNQPASLNQATNQPVYANQATNQPASLNQATNQPVYANQVTNQPASAIQQTSGQSASVNQQATDTQANPLNRKTFLSSVASGASNFATEFGKEVKYELGNQMVSEIKAKNAYNNRYGYPRYNVNSGYGRSPYGYGYNANNNAYYGANQGFYPGGYYNQVPVNANINSVAPIFTSTRPVAGTVTYAQPALNNLNMPPQSQYIPAAINSNQVACPPPGINQQPTPNPPASTKSDSWSMIYNSLFGKSNDTSANDKTNGCQQQTEYPMNQSQQHQTTQQQIQLPPLKRRIELQPPCYQQQQSPIEYAMMQQQAQAIQQQQALQPSVSPPSLSECQMIQQTAQTQSQVQPPTQQDEQGQFIQNSGQPSVAAELFNRQKRFNYPEIFPEPLPFPLDKVKSEMTL